MKSFLMTTLFSLFLFLQSCEKPAQLTIGVTTTIEDSGLLPVLIEKFNEKYSVAIKPVVASSGRIHSLIRNSDIESAITHQPAGENQLLNEGLIKEPTPLMHNDFILVGPIQDPAHVSHSLTLDEAFKKVINAKQTFISRDDHSGTFAMEQFWWQKANLGVDNSEVIKTGTGMGASLTVAAEKNAYILVDRATWNEFGNKQALAVLFEDSEILVNNYRLLSLSEKALAKSANAEFIQQWEQWLLTEGKTVIKEFSNNHSSVFIVD